MEAIVSSLFSDSPSVYVAVVVLETAVALLAVAGIGVLYLRRRSRPYLLVLLAFSTLLLRGIVGILGIIGVGTLDVSAFTMHNAVQHGLTVFLVAFLLLAVYLARDTPIEGEQS